MTKDELAHIFLDRKLRNLYYFFLVFLVNDKIFKQTAWQLFLPTKEERLILQTHHSCRKNENFSSLSRALALSLLSKEKNEEILLHS